MRYLMPLALAILIASAGFFAGQSLGSGKSAGAKSGSPVDRTEPASSSGGARVGAPDSPALTDAYELLRDTSSYEIYAAFHSAVRRLSLEEVRQLHRRVIAMPSNAGLLSATADRLVELDPSSALDFVRKFPNAAEVKDPTGMVIAWARRTPEAAIEEAAKLGGSSKAALLLEGAFDQLATKDPETAVSKLTAITDEKQRTKIFEMCLTNWASQDPARATKWVQAHPEMYGVGTDGNDTIAMFAYSVAARDVTIALEFSRGLNEPLRQQAIAAAARQWATKDPVAALAWARENGLPLTEQVTSTIGTIFSGALIRGPEKTAKWMESLPEGDERTELAAFALRTAKAGISPRLFALIPGNEQPKFVGPFMMSLNKQTSGAGRQWMLTLPEGDLRSAAMDNLIRTYWFKDPVAIIDTFPAGFSRDVGYAAHVRRSSGETGVPDVQQLSKIADKEFRQKTAMDAFVAWSRSDRAAARKWLDETPHISAESKTRLTQPRSPTDEE